MVKMLIFLIVINIVKIKGDLWSTINPTVFKIGGVLSSNDSEYYFKETIAVGFIINQKHQQNL